LAVESAHLLNIGTRLGGLALELVHAFDDSVSPRLHAVRPHRGQSVIASILRDLIKSSRLTKTRDSLHQVYEDKDDVHKIPMHVQEVYSLRCMPQVIGPVFDTLAVAWERIETEMNSVTDNPVVDVDESAFLHGGNFHGDYVAMAVDQLKAGIIKVTLLFERQINFFLSDHVNRSFPPFLNLMKPGLTLALQGMQFVATSTAAHSQSLGFPHYLHSIPTNADNQDIVSMGTDAALIALKALENAYIVVTIESIVLAQAVDSHAEGSELGQSSRDYFKSVRKLFPPVRDDRFMSIQQNELCKAIRSELFFDVAWFRNMLRHSPPRPAL
jgi:histidine ammonia-lyase